MSRISHQMRVFLSISFCALFIFPFASSAQTPKKWDILNYSGFKGQAPPSKEVLSVLERQAVWDSETGNLNPTGLRVRFKKIDEQTTPEGRVATRYRLYADGAPENKIFAFSIWTLAKTLSPDPADIYVNGQGLLMIHKPKPEQEMTYEAGSDEFIVTLMTDSAEPIRYLFSRRDGQLRVYGTIVPHPVMAEEQGCRIEVRLAQPDAKAVLVVIDGFPDREKVPVVLASQGVTDSEVLTTDGNGHAVMAVFPYVPGKTQGTLKASAEGPNCLPSVTLPWGAEAPVAPPAPKTP
ncbi:MAG: hypothetical protein ABSF70_11285 [Terracidiphilus sp.]